MFGHEMSWEDFERRGIERRLPKGKPPRNVSLLIDLGLIACCVALWIVLLAMVATR